MQTGSVRFKNVIVFGRAERHGLRTTYAALPGNNFASVIILRSSRSTLMLCVLVMADLFCGVRAYLPE